jgi:hypothetical protein
MRFKSVETVVSHVHPQPAIPFLLPAFDQYLPVAVSEMHGSHETMDLIVALIQSPGFGGCVANVVV